MYGVSARPRSRCEFATCDAPSNDGTSRADQPRPQGAVQICRDGSWRIGSLILFSCCLSLALSGCGGVNKASTETVQGSSGTDQGGTAAALLSGLSCTSASMTGSGTDSCTVTLTAAAPSGGLSANLSSSSANVTVPGTVTVPENATSSVFTATVSPVANAQSVTLTASAGSVSETFTLQVNATTPTLTVATSGSPSTYGNAVTFTATISSGPTGTVTFYDGNNTVSVGTGTINGTTATLTTSSLNAGSHTITASWPGNSNYGAVTSAAITQLVNKAAPAVSWSAPAAITYNTALSATQLDATSTVAGVFTYSPGAGTVLTAGTQALSATFTPLDSADFTSASATVSLTVNKATPSITWAASAPITYGTALSGVELDASASVAGSFTYSPAAGTVLAAGSHTLTATLTPADTIDYSTATASVPLTVNAVTPTTPAITWTTPAAITYGTALSATQLDATSTVAGTFAYTPAVGTVLKAGVQTLSVTFTPTDSTDYTTATATVPLTVNKATPSIAWAAPAAITYGTGLSAAQLDASSTVAGAFSYSPAAGTVLTAGSHTLTATFTPTDTPDYSTATATVTLTVNKATPNITWATPAAITYGTALSAAQLDASSTVAGSFTYSPVAGTVLSVGSQAITASFTPTDSTDYSTTTAAVTLTVNAATETISWTAPAAITYGTALSGTQLNATSSVAGTFAYSPAAGRVLTAGTQTLSVTFTPTNTTDYSTAATSVTLTVNKATPAITWATPAAITYGTALSAAQLDASSTVAGSFMYSPPAGIVLAAGSHTITATFTPTDSADYNSATTTVTLIVNPAAETIAWPAPAAITYGTALSGAQLDATSTVAGTFAYSPAAGAVLSAGTHTLSVTFTPTNTTDYSPATQSVSLTVNKATPTITWAAPSAIPYGTALSNIQLDASSTTSGTFTYSPAAGTVLTAGIHTLTATFTPTDNNDYSTATATDTLTVNPAMESISWTTPAAITYGTALTAAQLDATSTVAGTFAYSPGAGTVLTAGSHTLTATFTPTDTTDYSTATANVTLAVNQATPAITWATPASITSGTALSAAQLDASSTVAGSFAYSPTAGTVLSAGSHALTATFTPTDTTDYTTAAATVILTVTSATQTTPAITWTTPAAITYGTALSATQLDATSTVAGTFAYSPAAGTVLTAGSHTLTAIFTPTDTTGYTTATAAVTVIVNQATPAITWGTPAAIAYGTALSATQLDATSTVAGTFTYSPTAGTLLTTGSHTITATFSPTDATDYATATASVTLTVNQITSAITWATPAAISYGTALSNAQLDASSTVAGTFAYSPAAGTVLTAGSHIATATFTPADSTDYKTATATVTVTVNQATPVITWAAPAAIAYGTALSGTQLDASSAVPGTFVYSPAAGIVLAGGTQILSVTFTPTDSTDYSTATASVSLAVSTVTPTITWATPAAVSYGTALSATQLDATASVPGAFAYSPAAGTVLAAGLQTLLVTFTPTNTTDYSSATARVRLVVNAVTPTITWGTPAAISYGTALSAAQLDATASVPGTFAYSPAAGTVLAAGAQTLSVTFTPTDTTDYSSTTASIALNVNKATPAITWPSPAAIAYGTALSATQLDATSSVAGTFAYSPAAGTVPAAGSQTLSVTFTPTNTTDYSIATASVTLSVNTTAPTITWATPAAVAYGTALSATQLDATASVAGTFVYSPAAGTVPAAGSQTLSVTFTPTNTTDYSTATASVTLSVNKATPSITWGTPGAVPYGTALSATQLDATASVAGTFAYSPGAGTVPAAGSQTLFVTFTPTNTTDYSTATASVTLTVNKATPTITWATPAAIISGTALSATQLDATASVPGTFVYSPASGTVLATGSQTLSVTFTPTNTTDYATATDSVTLTVSAATSILSINATSIAFGNVALNTPTTQTVILTSSGTGSVTVNSVTLAGTGFTLSGPTFPETLTSGQTAQVGVEFDPTVLGAASGTLTVNSTSSTNPTAALAVTGSGIAATSYEVELSWDAPTDSTDPVAGYNIYRSPSGSSTYALLNSAVDTLTTYVDNTVQSGNAYDYIVESVDASGVESVPTSPVAVTIP
jgi:hypothetical protein